MLILVSLCSYYARTRHVPPFFLSSSILLLFCCYSARHLLFSALIMLELGMFLLSYFQLLFCFYSARNLLFFSSYYARTRHVFLETFFHVFPCYARNRRQISFLKPPIFGRVLYRFPVLNNWHIVCLFGLSQFCFVILN